MLFTEVVNEFMVQSFQANAAALANLFDVVSRRKNIRITEDKQRTSRRAVHEIQGCLKHRNAGAFRTDQSARNVKSILGQQRVEVQSGDAPRNPRKTCANQRSVL